LSIGEWFIHYTVDLYQLNTTPSDAGQAIAYGHDDTGSAAEKDLNAVGMQWIGSGDVVIYSNPAVTNVSFVTSDAGTYVVEVWEACNTGALTQTIFPTLSYYDVANLPAPVALQSCFLAGTFVVNALQASDAIAGNAAGTWSIRPNAGGNSPNTGITGCSATRFCFTTPGGTPFLLTGGTFSGGATMQRLITICKLDSSFHRDGIVDTRTVVNTAQNFFDQRTYFHTMRGIQQSSMSDADRFVMIKRINDIRGLGSMDENMLSVVIDAVELPINKGAVTSAMVSPAIAAVVLWAIKTFGPVLAAKAMRYLKEKLEKKK